MPSSYSGSAMFGSVPPPPPPPQFSFGPPPAMMAMAPMAMSSVNRFSRGAPMM